MDDRVKELLTRVKSTASNLGDAAGTTARYAGKCAGQMVDVAKLNMKIFDLKTDINSILKEIGQVVYDTHTGSDPDTAPLERLLVQIDEKNTAIGEIKTRIAVLRSCKQCLSCGASCGREDKFCKECGATL